MKDKTIELTPLSTSFRVKKVESGFFGLGK